MAQSSNVAIRKVLSPREKFKIWSVKVEPFFSLYFRAHRKHLEVSVQNQKIKCLLGNKAKYISVQYAAAGAKADFKREGATEFILTWPKA